jgi:hypothetical protein
MPNTSKTPVKQQQSSYDMPNTPGSKLGAGLEDGLLSASPEQPANLMLLHQLLGKHAMQPQSMLQKPSADTAGA